MRAAYRTVDQGLAPWGAPFCPPHGAILARGQAYLAEDLEAKDVRQALHYAAWLAEESLIPASAS